MSTSSFLNTFKPSYLRNNRRGGQKNIRCFPPCAEEGHKCSGFCGRTVHLELGTATVDVLAESGVPLPPKYIPDSQDVRLVGEFLQEQTNGIYNDEENATARPLVVGTSVTKDFLDQNTRIKEDPLRRFIAGSATRMRTDIPKKNLSAPVYGFRPSCWHYAWRSNKHCTNKQHCLRVYVFTQCASSDEFTCVEVVDSPLFSLFSSKQLDNYANDGVVPSGAIALFNAKLNRLQQMQPTGPLSSPSTGSKRRRSLSSEEEKTSDKAKSPKTKSPKPSYAKKRRVISAFTLAKRAARLATNGLEANVPADPVEFPYDAMIADCLGFPSTVKEEPDVTWSPKSVFFDVYDGPGDLFGEFSGGDFAESLRGFDEIISWDDTTNVSSWDFPLLE